MADYLLFRISAPLASWGEIAVGQIRSSWAEPSKSAVLGLVAAALGITREQTGRHRELHEGLAFAVRVHTNPVWTPVGRQQRFSPSRPLRDYHTAQSPSTRRNARWLTRAEELSPDNDINTILSERWYWQEFNATIGLRLRAPEFAPTLEAIAAALRRPAFPLYLGRKACPPSRPMRPRLLSFETWELAFQAYDRADDEAWRSLSGKSGQGSAQPPVLGKEIWLDPDSGETHRRMRRDAVGNRRAWTFNDRPEAVRQIQVNTEAD